MSKCISNHGEYSEHEMNGEAGEFTCAWCYVLDEDAIYAELAEARRAPDPTAAVEAGARACFEHSQVNDGEPQTWDGLTAMQQHTIREIVLPIVTAALATRP